MSTSVTFNGVSYTIPAIADASWGTNVSNYLVAIAAGCLQKTGGAFTLSAADVDFGATYGLKAVYFKSRTANIAAAGVVLLAVTDTINWRNNANAADNILGVDGSDNLIYNSAVLSTNTGSSTLTNKKLSDSTVTFVNVSDATKVLQVSLGSATTGTKTTLSFAQSTNRTLTFPDATDTLAVIATQQTFTNKLLSDSTVSFANVSDATKLLVFSLGGATTGKTMTFATSHTNNRTLTFPDATDTLAALAATQAFTNKDFQGGTASNTSRITVPSAATATLAGLTRKQATIVYDTTLNQLFSDDGSNLNPVGSGAGEKNYVSTGTSNAGGWTASGAGITVATDTTAADLPRAQTSKSGILLSRASGSTAYGYYRFTLDAADYNRKLKIKFDQKPGGSYVAADFRVDIYSNTAADYSGTSTRLALSTDASAVTALVNLTGQFQCAFDASGSAAPYMELRVGLNASTSGTTLAISDVIVGPGIQPQGAVVGPWLAYTPTVTGLTTPTVAAYYRRIGDSVQIFGSVINSANTSSATITFSLPSGLTINTAALPAGTSNSTGQRFGNATLYLNSPNDYYTATVQYSSSTAVQFFTLGAGVGTAASAMNQWGSSQPSTWGSTSDKFEFNAIIPVNEWVGSGTINVVQNDVEYAASTTGTWDAAAAAGNSVYGPGGAPMSGSLTAARAKVVQFQTPLQATDDIRLEYFSGSNNGWTDASISIYPAVNWPSAGFGASVSVGTAANQVTVNFNQYAAPGSTYNNATGQNWSSGSYSAWRVKKTKGGLAVGFGPAVGGVSAGLIAAAGVPGNATGNAIAAGYVGEVISSTGIGSAVTIGSSATLLTSVTLSAGTWLINYGVNVLETNAATNFGTFALGGTTGSLSGTVLGYDQFNVYMLAANGRSMGWASKVVTVSSSTSYFLNCTSPQGTAAQGDWRGSIVANRIA